MFYFLTEAPEANGTEAVKLGSKTCSVLDLSGGEPKTAEYTQSERLIRTVNTEEIGNRMCGSQDNLGHSSLDLKKLKVKTALTRIE